MQKSRDLILSLYRTMVLIREFELKAREVFRTGRMPGFIHVYIGEEAVATGVCAQLRIDDYVASTHRGHGHALAKGVTPRAAMAELLGAVTGCSGGRGGTMHLFDPTVGFLGSNGVVPPGILIASGAGLSAKLRGTDQVAVAFFGDGGSNNGAFHEGLNLAAAWEIPVVFVCENNLYATEMPFSKATKNTNVASRAAAYGMPGLQVDGNNVLEVYREGRRSHRTRSPRRRPNFVGMSDLSLVRSSRGRSGRSLPNERGDRSLEGTGSGQEAERRCHRGQDANRRGLRQG